MSDTPPVFDGFEIVRVLGKGGMGTVYLARDQRLGRLVALKVLNANDLADDRKARFLREARSAAAVRHQNVATIYEVDETADGVPFIVMEYCEGETLSQRIRRRRSDAAEFLSIARQIAAGVAAAHDKSIVHRDIKSANIIIEPNGLAKILDFGLAKSLPRSLTDPGQEKTFESASRPLLRDAALPLVPSRPAAPRPTRAAISSPSASCSITWPRAICRSTPRRR